MSTSSPCARNISRLRVLAATGLPLPRDLGEWALEIIETAMGESYRRQLRNDLIREAAGLLDGSTGSKARQLCDKARIIHRCWSVYGKSRPGEWSPRGRLVAANHVYRLPTTIKQYRRILDEGHPSYGDVPPFDTNM